MPIYTYRCQCGEEIERITPVSQHQKEVCCPRCGESARQAFLPSGAYLGNQDSPWLKKVLDVVDKTDYKRTTQEFLKNPTRSNYRAWMKAEGIRPIEDNERREKPAPFKPNAGVLLRRLRERQAVEVRSR